MPLNNVMRRVHGRVNPAAPWAAKFLIQPRQFKLERFPMRVQDEVNDFFWVLQFRAEYDAVRLTAPVRLEEFYAVPGFVRLAKQLV